MEIMELGAIGELVGGVAVIATLIYLAIQVRQVQLMTRVAAFDKTADSWNIICNACLENYELFCRGTEGYLALAPRDRLKFNFVLNQVLGYLENFHQKFQYGVIDQTEWERQYRVLLWYIAWPGMDVYWQDVRLAFADPFVALVDASFEGFRNGTIEAPDVSGMYITGEAH